MAAPRHRVGVLIKELVKAKPTTIVDLGCGGGQLLSEVARRLPDAQMAGFDLSERQIEVNRNAAPDVSWTACNLDEPAKFERAHHGAYEAVLALEILEHLDHPEELLENAGVLVSRDTGMLYLTTQSGPLRETERSVGHRRHFTAQEVEELLRATGWTPVRVWNTGFPFHDLSKWYANREPDKSMDRFGEASYGWYENAVCFALRLAFRLNSRRRGAQLFAIARRAG